MMKLLTIDLMPERGQVFSDVYKGYYWSAYRSYDGGIAEVVQIPHFHELLINYQWGQYPAHPLETHATGFFAPRPNNTFERLSVRMERLSRKFIDMLPELQPKD
jgi:hypothetical protein